MSALLVDTNVVSILFNQRHPLRQTCLSIVIGHSLLMSFMTRAELLLWPVANSWGDERRQVLNQHLATYLTLYPDESTCELWVQLTDRCRRLGQRIQTADAWIAATALQYGCPLVTADFRDYAAVEDLQVVPIF
jgi:predicted nucleic acid-binding protein